MLGILPSGGDVGMIVSSIVTGIFGSYIVWQNAKMKKNQSMSDGTTLGSQVEINAIKLSEVAQDAKLANTNASLVALQLAQYKAEQEANHKADQKMIEGYVNTDAQAHAELRSLIVQVATTRPEKLGGN